MARPRTPAGRARETHARLATLYPGTPVDLCELHHRSPFELLAATILSAQCTDKKVNEVTPRLFARFPDAVTLAGAEETEVQELIRPTGFYQAKTRSLLGMANAVVDRFDGIVPSRLEDLVTLPGVGRKTANVVLSVAFDEPGLPVDTHVLRLSQRLGLTDEVDPVKVETALNAMVPAAERGVFSLRTILHGRRVCDAKRPDCPGCALNDFCPSSTTRSGARPRSRRPSAAG